MSQKDLTYFLKLAEAEVHAMQSRLHAETKDASMPPQDRARKISGLRLLEELIKEQLPNENFSSATRTPR